MILTKDILITYISLLQLHEKVNPLIKIQILIFIT